MRDLLIKRPFLSLLSTSSMAFQTVNVTMELESPTGSPKVIENTKYFAGGWKRFGDGQKIANMELLSNDYSFKSQSIFGIH